MEEAIGLRVVRQAPVVQTSDSAIHRINHYPVEKYQENRLHYLLDRDLSTGQRYPPSEQLGPDDDQFALEEIRQARNFKYLFKCS